MTPTKQIVSVFKAVEMGAATSTEVSTATGLSVAHCSAHLSELELAGMIRRTGRHVGFNGAPRKSIVWEIGEPKERPNR